MKRIFTGLLLGLVLAFLFNYSFLNLTRRQFFDQILLMGVSTASFGFTIFSCWESRKQLKDFFLNTRLIQLKLWWIKFASVFRENTPGIVLALLFFFVYFSLGSFFNNPSNARTDNYLDADNQEWVERIASPDGHKMDMRAPHPFAFLIFRPLGWISNLFFRDPFRSATFLNSLAGGLCIIGAWSFIKTKTENPVYASIITTLLGLSTAHLVFGSIVETYIFSALVLIIFFQNLLSHKESTGSFVALGLLSFGITITNFVQTFIGYVITRPRWKTIIRFTGLVVSIGVILTLMHNVWYPTSKPFFLLSSSKGEEAFIFSLFLEQPWKVSGRIILLIRTMLLNSVIAPIPFVLLEQVGGQFPSFQFFEEFKLHGVYLYSEYRGLGNFLVSAWAILLLTACLLFLWNFVRSRKADLSFAFIVCLLFNFIVHFNYGEDPFLYSPNWTYALIFFVAIALAPLAKNRIFQMILLIFLLLLAYNQWQFIKFMMDTVISHQV